MALTAAAPSNLCPRCAGTTLVPRMTRQGVEVDHCPSCDGIWLDQGEIFAFSRHAGRLQAALAASVKQGRRGTLASPKTGRPMLRVLLGRTEIDLCEDTEGIWLDTGELARIASDEAAGLDLAPLQRPMRRGPLPTAPSALPNFHARAVWVLLGMMGLLGALLIACVELAGLPPGLAVTIAVAVAAFQFILGPFFMDTVLRLFYSCTWVELSELPEHVAESVRRLSEKARIPVPRVGIIADGAPNAFTYGHTPRNARIVLTEGLIQMLDPDETEAVIAHEIGHAVHWDMLLMTVASVIPMIAYYAYRTLIRMKGGGRTAGARIAVAIGAYVVYIVTTYMVLWLSRAREYAADRFAGQVTRNPRALSTALVKIGYGLAGQEPEAEDSKGTDDSSKTKSRRFLGSRERKSSLEAVGALGIFDPSAARALAISSHGGTQVDPENLKGAMRWDLWNPWATYYEIHSSHPLIANRLDQLGRQSISYGDEPLVVMDEQKPESYWDEFFVDLAFKQLPFLLPILALAVTWNGGLHSMLPAALAAFGLGSLFRTLFSYRGGPFPRMKVSSLLKQVKVSAVRGVPCTLDVTIIGRGVPGLLWSEDFVARDETGIMFLDYRQPLAILDFLFGLLRAGELQGQRATIFGWYRRAPMPFVEIKKIIHDGGNVRRCHVYPAKLVLSVLALVVGAWLMLF